MLHEWIRKKREGADLTQEDVAAALDVTQAYISRLENGRNRITVHLLQQLATAIGFDLAEAVRLPVREAA